MWLVKQLAAAGIGECTVRGELLSRKRDPWFYDNGAFRDWKAGEAFNAVRFSRDMRRLNVDVEFKVCPAPDFVVLPDRVAAGADSLTFSNEWWPEVGELPAYLAVQDGMTAENVDGWLDDVRKLDIGANVRGIFVGGSLEWKLATAASWASFAHSRALRCHVGRVGTPDRVRWAHELGADSIDSCLPLMFEEHLDQFIAALAECGGST